MLKQRVADLRCNTYALYLASRDPRVPVMVKVLVGAGVAYALSPIDLVPDFIPVLGYLDDLLILGFGLWLATRLVPAQVWQECRNAAQRQVATGRARWGAGLVIVGIWVLVGVWLFQLARTVT